MLKRPRNQRSPGGRRQCLLGSAPLKGHAVADSRSALTWDSRKSVSNAPGVALFEGRNVALPKAELVLSGEQMTAESSGRTGIPRATRLGIVFRENGE